MAAAAVVAVLCTVCAAAQNAQTLTLEGTKLLHDGKFAAAAAAFEAAMDANSDPAAPLIVEEDASVRTPVLMLHGVALLSLASEVESGDNPVRGSALRLRASLSLTGAARIAPNQAHVLSNLGLSHERSGSYNAAARLYDLAVELRPDLGMPLFNYANMLLMRNNDGSASAPFPLADGGVDASALAQLAGWGAPVAVGADALSLAFLSASDRRGGGSRSAAADASRAERTAAALALYERAASLMASKADVYENMGLALKRLGEDDSAWSDGAVWRAARGALGKVRGRPVVSRRDVLIWACDTLRRALELRPLKASVWYSLGMAQLSLGGEEPSPLPTLDGDRGKAGGRESRDMPHKASGAAPAAASAARSGLAPLPPPRTAVETLRRALALSPADVNIIADLGVALHARGDGIGEREGSAADRLWAAALVANPGAAQPQTHYNVARRLHNSFVAFTDARGEAGRRCAASVSASANVPGAACARHADPALWHFRASQRDAFRSMADVELLLTAEQTAGAGGAAGKEATSAIGVRIVSRWRGERGVAWLSVGASTDGAGGAYGEAPRVLERIDVKGFALSAPDVESFVPFRDADWETTVAVFLPNAARAWVVQGKAAVLHDVPAACGGAAPAAPSPCSVRIFAESQQPLIPLVDLRLVAAVDAALLALDKRPLRGVPRSAADVALRARAAETVERNDVLLKVTGFSSLNYYHFLLEGCARIALLRSYLQGVRARGSEREMGGDGVVVNGTDAAYAPEDDVERSLRGGRFKWLVPDAAAGGAFVAEATALLLPDALRGSGVVHWRHDSAPLVALRGVVTATWRWTGSRGGMQLCQPRAVLLHLRALFHRALALPARAARAKRAVVFVQRGTQRSVQAAAGAGATRASRSVANLEAVAQVCFVHKLQYVRLIFCSSFVCSSGYPCLLLFSSPSRRGCAPRSTRGARSRQRRLWPPAPPSPSTKSSTW